MRLALVVGARPQFVKLAPLMRRLPERIQARVIHTGQHYDPGMSEVFFEELALPAPHHHLGVGSGPHGAQTGRMLERLEAVLLQDPPDMVLVFGDTNSTLAAALAAAKLKIPIAHVEAGLRSFTQMPEEINRVLTDRLSSLLFAPSQAAVGHLRREGLVEGVHLVGDIMLDSALAALARQGGGGGGGAEEGDPLEPGPLVLTLHRAESTEDEERLGAVLEVLHGQGEAVLFPCHPRTRNLLRRQGWEDRLANGPVQLVDPVGHGAMLGMVKRARMVLTDSGGLQKEAYFLGTPCLTLREETEWVETVEAGWNRLVGLDGARILEGLQGLRPPSARPPLYGDGRTAERIVEVLEGWMDA